MVTFARGTATGCRWYAHGIYILCCATRRPNGTIPTSGFWQRAFGRARSVRRVRVTFFPAMITIIVITKIIKIMLRSSARISNQSKCDRKVFSEWSTFTQGLTFELGYYSRRTRELKYFRKSNDCGAALQDTLL